MNLRAGPRQRPDKNQPASDAWWNYVNDAILAEKLGFDSAFIGTSIICMPFHNPLRVAERGYHLIAPDVTGTYERVMREQGNNPADYNIGFVNMVSIARTKEEAFQAIAEPALWVNNVYALRRNLDGAWPPESARISLKSRCARITKPASRPARRCSRRSAVRSRT
jgi:alkanesulfonate monooxygenase SsuD/methylene tetrahydromethanopterin reductase-like flavin-dependent oxidoreductase (luciferase family)